jgi:hypothetical protein
MTCQFGTQATIFATLGDRVSEFWRPDGTPQSHLIPPFSDNSDRINQVNS